MGLRKSQSHAIARKHIPVSVAPQADLPHTPPAGAPSIFLAPDGDLAIFFPPSDGIVGHTCTISASDPATIGKLLLRILSERAIAPRAKIAQSVGVPTQALLVALSAGSSVKVFRKVLDAENLSEEDFG
jgi:hypothetical protein